MNRLAITTERRTLTDDCVDDLDLAFLSQIRVLFIHESKKLFAISAGALSVHVFKGFTTHETDPPKSLVLKRKFVMKTNKFYKFKIYNSNSITYKCFYVLHWSELKRDKVLFW